MTRPARHIALLTTVFYCFLFLLPTYGVYAQSLGRAKIEAEIQKLKTRDIQIRQKVIKTLKQASKESVPVLIEVLKNSQDTELQASAALALGQIGAESNIAATAVPELVDALKNQNEQVRLEAVEALQNISANNDITLQDKDAVFALITLIKKDINEDIQASAIVILGNTGTKAEAAIDILREKLKDRNNNKTIRGYTAWALGNIEAKKAIPDLIQSVEEDPEQNVRAYAANSLSIIAVSSLDSVEKLSGSELDEYIKNFERALEVVQRPNTGVEEKQIKPMQRLLTALKNEKQKQNLEVLKSPTALIVFAYLIFLPGLWLMFLWLRPLWLLKINQLLKPYTDFQLPSALGGIKVSLRTLLLVEFLNYHPRVLDEWVKRSIQSMRTEFQQKNTVRDRQIYIPIPVILEDQSLVELTAKDLRSVFDRNRGCLLIWGEGGAGKTSLACQIARWAMAENPEERLCSHLMLPILIEQEIDPTVVTGKSPFLEVIRGQLQDLTDTAEPIPEELLERLLRHRCILVIVDRFSEMSEATRKAIRPELPDFPVNALIVTSRVEEALGQVTKSTMKPMRIEGNRLSSFMECYLLRRGKRDLFSDSEFFHACSQLSVLVGQRTITVLLAKMYAEQMIAVKAGSLVSNLPDTVPDLMLRYLNELNRDAATGQPDNRTVHRDSKIIAWESLKHTYRPMPVKKDTVITAMGGDDAVSRLKYLEERLRIIQTIDAGHSLIRFSLDPLAEYLAALQMIELYNQNESDWNQFLTQVDMKIGSPASVQGLLLALRDCCLSSTHTVAVPAFLLAELNQRINFATNVN